MNCSNVIVCLACIFSAQRFQDDSTRNEIQSVVDDFIHQQRLGDDFDIFEDRHVFYVVYFLYHLPYFLFLSPPSIGRPSNVRRMYPSAQVK